MTIQDLGSIGELIAAVATIATLAYLAVQVRQNTRALRSSTFQQISMDMSLAGDAIARSSDLAAIIIKASAGLSALTPEERVRYHFYLVMTFRRLEAIYVQGILPPELSVLFSAVSPPLARFSSRYSGVGTPAEHPANVGAAGFELRKVTGGAASQRLHCALSNRALELTGRQPLGLLGVPAAGRRRGLVGDSGTACRRPSEGAWYLPGRPAAQCRSVRQLAFRVAQSPLRAFRPSRASSPACQC
jgi:hypothetical protein